MKFFKRILFYIFKPLNPIDVYKNRSVYSFTIYERLIELFSGDLKQLFLILKHLILFCLSFVYLIPSFILFFLKYKFVYVNFWQIGAPPQEIGTLVKYLKLSGVNEKKIIFLNPALISVTAEINVLFRKNIIVVENFFLYLILLPFLMIKHITIKPYLADSSHELTKYNLVNKVYEKNFKDNEIFEILDQEKNKVKKIFKKINLKKYVVINIRQNRNYFSNRNVEKIQNYKKTINFLLKKKFHIIRFMSTDDDIIQINHENFKQFNAENINLYNQFLTYKFAKFAIVTQSGPAGYASILNTPFVLTNSIDQLTNLTPKQKDIIIYKNILKHKKKNQILFRDNTPNEILNAIKKLMKY